MKDFIKTVTWKFKDSSVKYPQLKEREIKITSPQEIFVNFCFCSTARSEKGLLSSGETIVTWLPALR